MSPSFVILSALKVKAEIFVPAAKEKQQATLAGDSTQVS